MFIKGADQTIIDRSPGFQPFMAQTKSDLKHFSSKGFRTLAFGVKILDKVSLIAF